MTFIYELDLYSLEIHWMCKHELPKSFESYCLTDRHDHTMLLRGW